MSIIDRLSKVFISLKNKLSRQDTSPSSVTYPVKPLYPKVRTLAVVFLFVGVSALLLNFAYRKYRRHYAINKANWVEMTSSIESQNMEYDVNNDGGVTGEDINQILEMRKGAAATSVSQDGIRETEVAKSVPTTESTTSTDTTGAEAGVQILPSVRGAGSDEFTGSATYSYSFDLPQGPAGMVPPLSLSYSSGAVDDMYTGHLTKYRNDTNDTNDAFQQQSGLVGLGWSLNGMSYITRNTQKLLNYESEDTYIIVSGAGSADLVPESGNTGWDKDGYSVWRTSPNLNMKIERNQRCFEFPADPDAYYGGSRYVCRAQWIVTDKDGTVYTYGLPLEENWCRKADPEANMLSSFGVCRDTDGDGDIEPIIKDGVDYRYWYPLFPEDTYGNDDTACVGGVGWLLNGGDISFWGGVHAIVTQWPLVKVQNIMSQSSLDPKYNAEINYSYNLDLDKYTKPKDIENYYTHAVKPCRISYGKNTIDFVTEPRWDYKIHQGETVNWYDNENDRSRYMTQPQYLMDRLKKVLVSTDGQAIRSYVFSYKYGYDYNDHPDKNGTISILEDNEVIQGKAIHSLLEKITPYSGNAP